MSKEKKIGFIMCIIMSLVGAVYAYKLWRVDLRIPLFYSDGDCLFSLLTIKRSMHWGNFFNNSYLGAPFVGEFYDFPVFAGEWLNVLYYKLFANIFNDAVMGMNVGYLSMFPITAAISYQVMHKLGCNTVFSILGSVTYTFLPYRLLRNVQHLFLSTYYQVPLIVLLLFWLLYDKKFLKLGKNFFCYKRNWYGIFILVVVAQTGIYYAFFSAFFICIVAIYKIINTKEIKCVVNNVCAIVILCITIIIGSLPFIFYQVTYGENTLSPIRNSIEAEIYGLKFARLFIPNNDHGFSILESLKEKAANAPLPGEGTEYLGLMGILGLIILLLCLFCTNTLKTHEKVQKILILSRLNIFGIMLGTIGGFGSLFAMIISPQIRAYNRISVFISFFSLLAIGLMLTWLQEKGKIKKFVILVAFFLYVIGCVEQISNVPYSQNISEVSYKSDEKFIKKIEERVTENAMIYQWVYQPFPENPPINNMGDYASVRGYLHSDTLRWSYGGYKGRKSDLWNKDLATKSITERINIISNVGFEGVYIDTCAYEEEELEELLNKLKELLGNEPLVSEDGRCMYFDLQSYTNKYKSTYTTEDWENMRCSNLICYGDGFYGLESQNNSTWRWASNEAKMQLDICEINKSNKTRYLVADIYGSTQEMQTLIVKCNGEEYCYSINSSGLQIKVPLSYCEENEICFSTTGMPVDAPEDPRTMCMRFQNVKVSG